MIGSPSRGEINDQLNRFKRRERILPAEVVQSSNPTEFYDFADSISDEMAAAIEEATRDLHIMGEIQEESYEPENETARKIH